MAFGWRWKVGWSPCCSHVIGINTLDPLCIGAHSTTGCIYLPTWAVSALEPTDSSANSWVAMFRCLHGVASHFNLRGTVCVAPLEEEDETHRWKRQRNGWKRANNYMPPFNPMKLGRRGGFFFFLRLRTGLPSHLIEEPNDLFESRLPAPGWGGMNRKKKTARQTSPARCAAGGEMGAESRRQPAWHSERCERCPSLPLMHPGVVDWFFFCAGAGVLMS